MVLTQSLNRFYSQGVCLQKKIKTNATFRPGEHSTLIAANAQNPTKTNPSLPDVPKSSLSAIPVRYSRNRRGRNRAVDVRHTANLIPIQQAVDILVDTRSWPQDTHWQPTGTPLVDTCFESHRFSSSACEKLARTVATPTADGLGEWGTDSSWLARAESVAVVFLRAVMGFFEFLCRINRYSY